MRRAQGGWEGGPCIDRDGRACSGVRRRRGQPAATGRRVSGRIAFTPPTPGVCHVRVRVVGVRIRQFPNGGFWALLVCPRCDARSQRIRLLDGQPACGKCIRASGLIYRSQSVRTETRHLVTAPPRLALLGGHKPARINPRPGRKLDRRAPIEAALKRSLLVARRRGIAVFEKKLIGP